MMVKTVIANLHPLGTCAMMSRLLGGVVDSELRVYVANNVRVVDASLMPLQIRSFKRKRVCDCGEGGGFDKGGVVRCFSTK